jgi:TolA-binding protein
MPDLHSPENEAALYVLGELTAAERCEFEARLARSAELRGLVRELEEGAVALSMASPRRRPPQEVWTRIEKSVTGKTRRRAVIPLFGAGWWGYGWAAAAACLAGWLLYALWTPRPGSPRLPAGTVAAGVNSLPAETLADSQPAKSTTPGRTDDAENTAALQALQSSAQEIGVLRRQMAELTNRVAQLSQALAQRQALLTEASRLKFFQLGPFSAGRNGAMNVPVSPELQRALLLAMARELGWTPPGAASETGGIESTRTNQSGVDFVDLRPDRNNAAPATDQLPVELAQTGEAGLSSLGVASSNAIPGFVSGTNAVLAFDASVVAAGSSLTFLTPLSSGGFQSLGTTVLGNNPLVVTIPFAASGLAGGNVFVIAGTASGSSAVIGQFSTPGVTSP